MLRGRTFKFVKKSFVRPAYSECRWFGLKTPGGVNTDGTSKPSVSAGDDDDEAMDDQAFVESFRQKEPKENRAYSSILPENVPEGMRETTQSWPSLDEDNFDLLNIPKKWATGEEEAALFDAASKNVPEHLRFENIILPSIAVDIPKDHDEAEGLELMKMSLESNPHLCMDDKNEILQGALDTLHVIKTDPKYQHDIPEVALPPNPLEYEDDYEY